MEKKCISGKRQYDFVSEFSYVREAGTEGEAKAAQAILEYLKQFGAEGRLEAFPIKVDQMQEARLIITEPYEKEYLVTGYEACGSTAKEGIEAPFLYVENGDPISLSHARGKIVLVNELKEKKDWYQDLCAAGVAGFVSITGSPLDKGEDLVPPMRRLRGEAVSPVQGARVHYQDAVELVTKGASRAKLIVRQETVTKMSSNVVVRIEGTDKAEEILTLTAHYDSVPAGPGAYDNMSGAAIIMELCRYFTEHRPRRTMEFVWFGAEEKGLQGSRYYVEAHEDELPRHRFNMNVDLAGQMIGGTVIGMAAETAACEAVIKFAKEIDLGMTVLHRIWSSDSNTFAWKGIPAMTLNRDGFGMHTRYDTIDLISSWSLERSAALLCYIAEQLGNLDEIPFPRSVPAEFVEKLDRQFLSR